LGSAFLQNLMQGNGLFLIQILLLLLLGILSFFLPSAGVGAALLWWLGLALSAVLLLTFSLSGHNAALGNPLAVAGDWLHLAGMSVWLGGLPCLAWMLLRQKRLADPDIAPSMISAVERFSWLARTSVILLGLTGLYSAFLQVQTVQALFATRYGQAILVKSSLFALLILLGAANERLLMPRMRQSGLPALAQLGKTVRVETGLGVALLLGVGALMSLAPAHEALLADYRLGIHDQWQENGVQMDFRVAPAQVGENEIGIIVSDHRPGAQSVQPAVLLRIQAELEDTGVTQVEAKEAGGRYTVRGSYFSRMEPWLVEVIWRKAGFDDVTHTFTVDLAQHMENLGEKVNPVPATSASIDAGRVVYRQNCIPCHGADAKGDGPLAHTMDPAPADLTYHMAPGVHPDGDIFNWISNGFPGSAMPAFKDHLSEQQRWDVINYLRSVAAAK
jgi:putative copper export protein/mono/diheme cytochrome c family protein